MRFVGSINKLKLLHQAQKNQWLKPPELKELQTKRLRSIVKHAYENTGFYHRKFKDAKLHPDIIKTLNNLKKIPFTTKGEFREQKLESRISKCIDLGRCRVIIKNCLTRMPIKVVYDEIVTDLSKIINLSFHIANGVKLKSKRVVFQYSVQVFLHSLDYKKTLWFKKINTLNDFMLVLKSTH